MRSTSFSFSSFQRLPFVAASLALGALSAACPPECESLLDCSIGEVCSVDGACVAEAALSGEGEGEAGGEGEGGEGEGEGEGEGQGGGCQRDASDADATYILSHMRFSSGTSVSVTDVTDATGGACCLYSQFDVVIRSDGRIVYYWFGDSLFRTFSPDAIENDEQGCAPQPNVPELQDNDVVIGEIAPGCGGMAGMFAFPDSDEIVYTCPEVPGGLNSSLNIDGIEVYDGLDIVAAGTDRRLLTGFNAGTLRIVDGQVITPVTGTSSGAVVAARADGDDFLVAIDTDDTTEGQAFAAFRIAANGTATPLAPLPVTPVTQSFNVIPGALDRAGALYVGGSLADQGDVIFKMAPGDAEAEVLYLDSDDGLMLIDIPYSFVHHP